MNVGQRTGFNLILMALLEYGIKGLRNEILLRQAYRQDRSHLGW